jgi:hypothetical protein
LIRWEAPVVAKLERVPLRDALPSERAKLLRAVLRIVAVSSLVCAAIFPTQPHSEQFGAWEVDTPPGSDPYYEKRASHVLRASDLRWIEYSPNLSVTCERWAIGPYGASRANYKALSVDIQWFAERLPKDFESLATFLRTGIDADAVDPRGNIVWVNYGRAWTATHGFSELIKIGNDDSSPIETVKITGIPKGFRYSANVLDSGIAEAFLRAWNPSGQIPVVLQDALTHDLERTVDLQGMKPAVDRVLDFCGRNPL